MNRTRLVLPFAVAVSCIVLFGAAPVQAQYFGGGPYGYGYGNGMGGGTVAGNYAAGMADVIRSQGAKNLMDSEAAKNYEDARSKNYDNRIKGTQTYFEMRRMNTAYRDAEREKPLTSEAAFRHAHEAAPARLNHKQLDPITGQINWPTIIKDARYETDRKMLDTLFSMREKAHGGLSAEEYNEINKSAQALLASLKSNIKEYAPNDYIQARKFVESLSYEARFGASG